MKRRTKKYKPMEKKAVFVLLAILLFTMGLTLQSEPAFAPTAIISKTVQPGDTVWDLAADYNPEGHDIRNYVAMITDLNELGNQPLQPGQTIRIPILP